VRGREDTTCIDATDALVVHSSFLSIAWREDGKVRRDMTCKSKARFQRKDPNLLTRNVPAQNWVAHLA